MFWPFDKKIVSAGWKNFKPLSRKSILKAAAGGVIAYSILVLVYSNSVPDLGVEIFGRAVRACSEPPVVGQTPKAGDHLVAVSGRPIDSLPRYVNVLANLRNTAKNPPVAIASTAELRTGTSACCNLDKRLFVRLDFLSGDSNSASYSSWFEVHDPPWQKSAFSIVWFAAESLIFWTGWLAFRRKPDDDAGALFFLMCIVTVGAYMGGYHWLRVASSPALLLMFAVCAMAVPQISLHFFLVFPRPKRFLIKRPLATYFALYGVPAAFQIAILITIGGVVSMFRHRQSAEIISARVATLWWMISIYLLISSFMFACSVISLIHAYLTTKQPVQRNQVRWILVGATASTVFVSFAMLKAFTDPVGFALGNATWAMFVASLVFTWAYAVSILKYRLLDVQEILQRGMLYLAITFIAGLLYYGLLLLTLWLAPQLAADASRGQALFAPVAVLGVLLVLGSIRSRVQKVVDRRFFREKRRLEKTLRRMDEALGKLVDPKALNERGLAVVADALAAKDAGIYSAKGDRLELSASLGEFAAPVKLSADHPLLVELLRNDLIQLTPESLFLGDRLAEILHASGIELVHAVRAEGKLVGAIVLSSKADGAYESSDLEFLQAFAQLLGLLLSTAQSQATLEKLNEDLQDKVARLSRQTTQLMAFQGQVDAGPPRGESAVGDSEAAAEKSFPLVGSGKALRDLSRMAERVAASPATVLIRGESGTGKTMLAEVLHQQSSRSAGPFVKVHCAALSPTLLESELFGHVKGAFTGAHRDKVGRFQLADGGSLFLDEIGDIPLDLQTKLLRILQEMTFEPVGANEPVKVDVRIIAATHQPLEELIEQRRFREDLFYRLNVISLWMPPLRDRQEDIVDLSVHFVRKFSTEAGKPIQAIDDEALKLLVDYFWPGNVRELENVIERAVVLATGSTLAVADLPIEIQLPSLSALQKRRSPSPQLAAVGASTAESASMPSSFASEIEEVERIRLVEALRSAGGNKSKAAALLGLPRSTFCSKLKKVGLL